MFNTSNVQRFHFKKFTGATIQGQSSICLQRSMLGYRVVNKYSLFIAVISLCLLSSSGLVMCHGMIAFTATITDVCLIISRCAIVTQCSQLEDFAFLPHVLDLTFVFLFLPLVSLAVCGFHRDNVEGNVASREGGSVCAGSSEEDTSPVQRDNRQVDPGAGRKRAFGGLLFSHLAETVLVCGGSRV